MFPLESLLHRLESAGFQISPADRLRIVQLLDVMGRQCIDEPQKLRLLLAPILARSAAEQAKFYAVFDQWMPAPAAAVKTGRSRKIWFVLLAVACLAIAAWFIFRPVVKRGQQNHRPDNITQTTTDSGDAGISRDKAKPDSSKKDVLKPRLDTRPLLNARESKQPQPTWLAWAILAALSLAALLAWRRWWKRRAPDNRPANRQRDTRNYGDFTDGPPYTIPFRGQEAFIKAGREQYRLADALRQRQQGEHPYMDIPASVKATLDRGGYPTLRFRLRSQPADYLCIIEEKHGLSHLARLFRFFAGHIRGQDVALDIFYTNTGFDRFWNQQTPSGLTLDQLQRLFPAHRLVVFGDAHGLLDVAAQNAARVRPERSAAFKRWRQRLLFSPLSPLAWTFEEKALYDLFVLFPATLQGMNDAAQYIESSVGVATDEDAPPAFARWRERAQQRASERHDHRYTRWRDLADHEQYLSKRPDLMLWLRALAVYPTPTWEITLAIGQALEGQGVTVRPDDLLVLSRIDWLQTGKLHPDLRADLLESLPDEVETIARKAVIGALESAKAEAGRGFAGVELDINTTLQEFALAPEDPERQEDMRRLFAAGKINKTQEKVADAALARHLQRQKPQISKLAAPEETLGVRDFVKRQETEQAPDKPPARPFFTASFWMALLATLGAAGFGLAMYLLWFYWSWFPAPEDSNRALRPLVRWKTASDSATVWNNRGVDAWNNDGDATAALDWFLKAFATDSAAVRGIDTLFADSLYNGAIMGYINAQKLRYNLAADSLNALFERLPLPSFNADLLAKINVIRRKNSPTRVPTAYLDAMETLAAETYGAGYNREVLRNASTLLGALNEFKPLGNIDESAIPGLREDALHAEGLIALYYLQRDGAETYYANILSRDSLYFKNLRSARPNLERLLGKYFDRIFDVQTNIDARGRLTGTIYFQLKENLKPGQGLTVELIDRNRKVVQQTPARVELGSKGANNMATFILPVDLRTGPFTSDTLRVRLISGNGKAASDVFARTLRYDWKGRNNNRPPDVPLPGITVNLLTNSKNRPGLRDDQQYAIRRLKGIVMHWTANESSASQNRDYFNLGNANASAHYLVDENNVIQCIPDNEVAYHIGTPKPTPLARRLVEDEKLNLNYYMLGVEMCDSDKGVRDWPRTYARTVAFVRELLKKHGLTVNNLYRHSDLAYDKICPKEFQDDRVWEQFKKDVEGQKTPGDSGNNGQPGKDGTRTPVLQGEWRWLNPEPPPTMLVKQSDLNVVLVLQLNNEVPETENFNEAKVYVNNVAMEASPKISIEGKNAIRFEFNIQLDQGRSRLFAVYHDLRSEEAQVLYEPQKPNLTLFAIGPSYKDVRYTVSDVQSIARAAVAQEGVLYGNVNTIVKTGSSASTTEIGKGLENLKYSGLKANDVLWVYIAAKFISRNGRMYLVADDVNPDLPPSSSNDILNLVNALNDIPCKTLLMIDGCSTVADKKQPDQQSSVIQNAKGFNGVMILSNGPNQVSFEDVSWQHGAFTYEVLNALNGRADANGDLFITVDELFGYVEKAVPALVARNIKTKGTQTPIMPFRGFSGSTVLFRVNSSGK